MSTATRTLTLELHEVDEALANCRASLRATHDKEAREAIEDYRDTLLDRRNDLTAAKGR